MANRADITPELLRQLLRYEPETGRLFWRARLGHHFARGGYVPPKGYAEKWNTKNAGLEALTAVKSTGYKHGSILGSTFTAHRVAFAVFYGRWPNHIDHINGNRTDNRIENLRDVTPSQNHKNRRKHRGVNARIGVSYSSKKGKWQAQICSEGRNMHLGYYDDEADATNARVAAERKLGFHDNHGRLT